MTVRNLETKQVAGLHVTDWPGDGPTVVGLPGLGSSGRAWDALARELADTRFVAPDLRGRGRSNPAVGPTGLRAHAIDIARLLDELDLHDVVLVGHSMGAFLAPIAAQEADGRVARLVLLDGGVPPKFPFFLRPGVVRAMFRRNLRKLDHEWPDVATFVTANIGKALDSRPDLLPVITEMLVHELGGPEGALRPTLDADRAVADAIDTFFGPDVVAALDALTIPAHLLAASGQKRDGGKPFLSDGVIAHWTQRVPTLTAERVDANHLTLLFAPEVTRAVAR